MRKKQGKMWQKINRKTFWEVLKGFLNNQNAMDLVFMKVQRAFHSVDNLHQPTIYHGNLDSLF